MIAAAAGKYISIFNAGRVQHVLLGFAQVGNSFFLLAVHAGVELYATPAYFIIDWPLFQKYSSCINWGRLGLVWLA